MIRQTVYSLLQRGPNRRAVARAAQPGQLFFARELGWLLGRDDAWLAQAAAEYRQCPAAWQRLSGLRSATRRTDGFAKSLDVAEGFALWALVKHLRPHVVVELGTQHGVSARLWKEALRAYVPDHRLYLCDLVDVRRFIGNEEATFMLGDARASLARILAEQPVDLLFNDAHPYALIVDTVTRGMAAQIPCFVFHDVSPNPQRGRPFRAESHALSEDERRANEMNLAQYGHWERHCMADLFDAHLLTATAAENALWRAQIFESLYGLGVVLRRAPTQPGA